ncbi:hypothetical protein Glove_487g28 [Diversispora epigaea]|uniref:Integrase core domain-containing protein n=1 Tax=Diversispora epigaea TaxID=1348612 RepID=A0A397GN76_9GLOM|nr:hypothetical protein Glove_487g28 [Diversispora epigaea]
MLINKGLNRGSYIGGQSFHNQRIERLWRDLFRCITKNFVLALEEFTRSWNNHKLRTESNFTPRQLFINGAIQNSSVLDNIVNLNDYGIDWEGPLSEPEFEQVNINEISNILNSQQLILLQQNFNVLNYDGNFGINIYIQVKNF